jgi:hypothetical protein
MQQFALRMYWMLASDYLRMSMGHIGNSFIASRLLNI